MTAITDISTGRDLGQPPRMVDGERWIWRAVQRFFGAAIVLAALGLWIVPAMTFEADVALFKLGLSITFGFAGLAILQAGRRRRSIAVEIDTIRREVRLVRGHGATRKLVARTAIADLGPAEVRGQMARLWSSDGTLVAEVALSDPDLRRSLLGALRDAGKL
ncbi:MAG: hypothetical protein AAF727_01960 [Pseudomonadota bacterium]